MEGFMTSPRAIPGNNRRIGSRIFTIFRMNVASSRYNPMRFAAEAPLNGEAPEYSRREIQYSRGTYIWIMLKLEVAAEAPTSSPGRRSPRDSQPQLPHERRNRQK